MIKAEYQRVQRWMIRKHKALWCGGHGAFIVQLTYTVRNLSKRSKSEVFYKR